MEAERRLRLGGNPDWMSLLPEELLGVPLWNLALPGSHDSMSFCLDMSSPVLRSEPPLLRLTDWLFPCWTRPCVYRWATTQDSPTLRSCWSRGQQVIVSYGDQDMVQQHPELWSGIPYWFADSTDPKEVIAYLEYQKHKGRPAGFYASGLNLTEHAPYILLHPFQDMRKMTARALSPLLRWASEQRPGPQVGGVNILCCDFVAISQFCSLVIGLNSKLLGGEKAN